MEKINEVVDEIIKSSEDARWERCKRLQEVLVQLTNIEVTRINKEII